MMLALVGNQNCGKTTLFNALTGSNQHVGNFPGVTVEGKIGVLKSDKKTKIADLPGIYSLRPFSSEEIVTRDFIIRSKPDGIINIVDATNLERNLYLTLQLMELQIPMVLALNMMDEVRANRGSIDIDALSDALGFPVVPISAVKNEGIEELMRRATLVASEKIYPQKWDICPDGALHRCIHAVTHVVEDHAAQAGVSRRFAAIRLIEGEEDMVGSLGINENEVDLIEHSVKEMEDETGFDRNEAIAEMRYTYIEEICAKAVKKPKISREKLRSDRIDRVLTNRFAAIPLFVLIMCTVFYLTFGPIGTTLSDWLAAGIDWFTAVADGWLGDFGINPVVHSLVIDGIFAGVGSVLSFLPLIVVLFFFLSILEDSGYMARVAFFMDKLLRKIGLSGKSFVPMLIGFGCSVPAIMATRTLSSERDKKLTVMLIPFMSCTAKIPIYTVFCAAFFPDHAALVMSALYFGGILVGILAALLLKKTIFRGKPNPFVMELPNYRFPSVKTTCILLWEKARDFMQRAFTVIFLASIIIWFLRSFDIRLNLVENSADSILANLGRWIAPVFAPLGFGDWRVATSLVSGFSAKEAVVSTLEVLVDGGLATLFTPVTAITFLTFTLLYTPCVAAVATINREIGSRAKTFLIVVFQCVLAWCVACAVHLVASAVV